LYNLWISKIQKWSPKITFDEFVFTYKNARELIEKNAQKNRGEFAEFRDDELWMEILTRLNIAHPKEKTPDMLEVELEYERQIRQPVPEMVKVVKEAIALYGEKSVGVFSNSRMPKEHVVELLKAHGFVGIEGMLKEENILVSSDLGVKKPDSKTIENLSSVISVPPREIIFIGDDAVDVNATGRSQAIGVQLIRPYHKK
jgi:FMN phosphatase YigB (HAD superfamily)